MLQKARRPTNKVNSSIISLTTVLLLQMYMQLLFNSSDLSVVCLLGKYTKIHRPTDYILRGPSIKYVTLLANFDPLPLSHFVTHPGNRPESTSHISDPPHFQQAQYKIPDKSPLYKFSLNCSRGFLSGGFCPGGLLCGECFVRGGFCPFPLGYAAASIWFEIWGGH